MNTIGISNDFFEWLFLEGWRDDCEDGSEYGIDPEDYDFEEEYIEALEEAKRAWRVLYKNESTSIDTEDCDTEDEYDDDDFED